MLDTRQVFASINTEWTVPSDLPYFEGHFPGQPIFPAVGIVDASLAMVQRKLGGKSVALLSITAAKFTRPIGPNQKVHIQVTQTGETGWRVNWLDSTDHAKKFASLLLQAREEAP